MKVRPSTPRAVLTAAAEYRDAGMRFQRANHRLMLATFSHNDSKIASTALARKRAERNYESAKDKLLSAASLYEAGRLRSR